jgi:hypothetical protein
VDQSFLSLNKDLLYLISYFYLLNFYYNKYRLPPIRLLLPLNKSILPPIRLLLPLNKSILPPIRLLLPLDKSILPPIRLLLPHNKYIFPPIRLLLPLQNSILPPIRILLALKPILPLTKPIIALTFFLNLFSLKKAVSRDCQPLTSGPVIYHLKYF